MTTTETKTDLTFAQLRAASLKRCPLFRNAKGELCHPTGVMDWSPDQWMTALVGEVGEAANDIKKVNRGDLSLEEALPKIGSEIADAQTYLDLLAARLGLSLAEITIAKFNEVSQKVGCDIFLGEAPATPDPERALMVEIANALTGEWSLEDEPVVTRAIEFAGIRMWVAETRTVGGGVGHKAWGYTKLAALWDLHRLVGAVPAAAPTPESPSAAEPAPQVARKNLFHCPKCGKHGHLRQGDPKWRCHGCEVSWELLPIQDPTAQPGSPRRSAANQCAELATRLNQVKNVAGIYGTGSELDAALGSLAAFLNENYQPTGQ